METSLQRFAQPKDLCMGVSAIFRDSLSLRVSLITSCSETSKGRLGLTKIPNSTLRDVPRPAELQIKSGAPIVSLSAAGWYVVVVLYDKPAHVTPKGLSLHWILLVAYTCGVSPQMIVR
jgi:hypothetical protein